MGHHHRTDVEAVTVAVVTISDTRAGDDDPSGDLVATLIRAAGHVVKHRSHVKDDAVDIQKAIDVHLDDGVDVIITTGGTGIAPRDVTYEAVSEKLEKRLDGFGEAFRRLSWDEIGARSVLSRALAGTIKKTLVFALPGSTKAVQLAVEKVIVPMLGHAVGLLR